jgi:hypothetical protein
MKILAQLLQGQAANGGVAGFLVVSEAARFGFWKFGK